MASVEKREAKSWIKCSCCNEQIRTCEKFFQVVDNGKAIRGERYCEDCEPMLYENNNIDIEDDGESHLRQMEDFASYHAAGCTSAYWEDRDAGYAH